MKNFLELLATNNRDLLAYPEYWDSKVVDKMRNKSHKERLVIAGALIAASNV